MIYAENRISLKLGRFTKSSLIDFTFGDNSDIPKQLFGDNCNLVKGRETKGLHFLEMKAWVTSTDKLKC